MQFLRDIKNSNWVWLSHPLSSSTPAYGDGDGFIVESIRSIDSGDSCNTVHLSFSNHLGSHVDSPRHFLLNGKTVDDYNIKEWIFNKPWLIDIPSEEGEIIGLNRFEKALGECHDADLLLIRTGFAAHRGSKKYWSSSPSFHPELASYLQNRLKSLIAIGLDTISLTSYLHRELGREAHRAFLNRDIRIFEDLALEQSIQGNEIRLVKALPLVFEKADGAPCSIIALLANPSINDQT